MGVFKDFKGGREEEEEEEEEEKKKKKEGFYESFEETKNNDYAFGPPLITAFRHGIISMADLFPRSLTYSYTQLTQ